MDEEKEDPYKHVCVQTDTHTHTYSQGTNRCFMHVHVQRVC